MQGDAGAHLRATCADWLGEPASAVPGVTGRRAERRGLVAGDLHVGARGRRAPRILRAFPSLAHAASAPRQRATPTHSPSSTAIVAAAGPVLDPSRTGRLDLGDDARETRRSARSASSWSRASACKADRGSGRRKTTRWLDPATKGHGAARPVRARHAARPRARSGSPTWPRTCRACGAGASSGSTTCAPRCRRHPTRCSRASGASSWTISMRSSTAECEGRHGQRPVGFEVRFGFPLEDDEEEPLASAEPVSSRPRRQAGASRSTAGSTASTALAPGEVRGDRLQDGRLLGDDWEGELRGRHAAAARALRVGRGGGPARVDREGTASSAGSTSSRRCKGHRRQKAIAAPSTSTLIDRAARPAGRHRHRRLRCPRRRPGVPVVRLRGRVPCGDPDGDGRAKARAAKKVDDTPRARCSTSFRA